jgi:hypothetical protein
LIFKGNPSFEAFWEPPASLASFLSLLPSSTPTPSFHQTFFPSLPQEDSPVDSTKTEEEMPDLNDLEKRLPSDYQSIREKISDSKFDCKDHEPGYYADIENDCQVGSH